MVRTHVTLRHLPARRLLARLPPTHESGQRSHSLFASGTLTQFRILCRRRQVLLEFGQRFALLATLLALSLVRHGEKRGENGERERRGGTRNLKDFNINHAPSLPSLRLDPVNAVRGN